MAYFNELPKDVRNEVWEILSHKVKVSKKHPTIRTSIIEAVDSWINCHNEDLSNRDWIKQANDSDI